MSVRCLLVALFALSLPLDALCQTMQDRPGFNEGEEGNDGEDFLGDSLGFNPWTDTLVGSWTSDVQAAFDNVPDGPQLEFRSIMAWKCEYMQSPFQNWRYERHRYMLQAPLFNRARVDGELLMVVGRSRSRIWGKAESSLVNVGIPTTFGLPQRSTSKTDMWHCRYIGAEIGEVEGQVLGQGFAMSELSKGGLLALGGAAVEAAAGVHYLSQHNGMVHGDIRIEAEENRATDAGTLAEAQGFGISIPVPAPSFGWGAFATVAEPKPVTEDDQGLLTFDLKLHVSGKLTGVFVPALLDQGAVYCLKGQAWAAVGGNIYLVEIPREQ